MPPVTYEAPVAPSLFLAPKKQYYLLWDYPPYGTNIQFDVWRSNLTSWSFNGTTTNKNYPIDTTTKNAGLFRVRVHDLKTGQYSWDW